MGASGVEAWFVLVALATACGAPADRSVANPSAELPSSTTRLPVTPCDQPSTPSAIGVWQTADREEAFVYDGCTVRFSDELTQEPAIFGGQRNIARAFVVDVRDFADPFPHFRARARWDGDELQGISILGTTHVATWDGERFWRRHPWRAFFHATAAAQLDRRASDLLRVERIIPTEAELAERRGVEMPEDDAPAGDFVPSILCPTRDCDVEYE